MVDKRRKGKRKVEPTRENEIDRKIRSFVEKKEFGRKVADDVVSRFSNFIRKQIGKKIGTRNPDLPDLCQTVWVKVKNYISGSLLEVTGKPDRWLGKLLKKIAHDVCYDYLQKKGKFSRRRDRRRSVPGSAVDSGTSTDMEELQNHRAEDYKKVLQGDVSIDQVPEAVLAVQPHYDKIVDSILRPVFNALSPRDKAVINEILYMDSSYDEAYKALGFPTLGACKTGCHRAKQRFYDKVVQSTKQFLDDPAIRELLGRSTLDIVSNIRERALESLKDKA